MSLTDADRQDASPRRGTRLVAAAALAGVVALFAVAVLLWLKNGTAVFFETLAAGIAACF